jgi:uncharacterized membrane protein
MTPPRRGARFGRLGVQTDMAGSCLAAVFIPNSPNAFSGSVVFVASDKVRPLDLPLASALNCLEQLGAKGGSFLSNLSLVDSKSL